MKLFLSFFKAPQAVKLEIQPNVLAALMANGQLHATDFRCLDLGSKQIVWKMLLSLAKSKLTAAGNHCKPRISILNLSVQHEDTTMTKKPCNHEYLAASESGKVLICRDCGVVHLQLQNLSMRFEVEQFAALADMLTVASKKMLQQPQTATATRPKLTLVH